jgi:membrane associated rhomboid family serine protease
VSVRSMYVIIVFFCYNLVMSLWPRQEVQEVAYEAHICGMAFGFVVMLLLLASRLLPRDENDLLAMLGGRRAQLTHLQETGKMPMPRKEG